MGRIHVTPSNKYFGSVKDDYNTIFSGVIYAIFFPILAAEKSGCVKYADFFVEVLIWFYSSIIENTARFVNILL